MTPKPWQVARTALGRGGGPRLPGPPGKFLLWGFCFCSFPLALPQLSCRLGGTDRKGRGPSCALWSHPHPHPHGPVREPCGPVETLGAPGPSWGGGPATQDQAALGRARPVLCDLVCGCTSLSRKESPWAPSTLAPQSRILARLLPQSKILGPCTLTVALPLGGLSLKTERETDRQTRHHGTAPPAMELSSVFWCSQVVLELRSTHARCALCLISDRSTRASLVTLKRAGPAP